jgi:hypothetical protein
MSSCCESISVTDAQTDSERAYTEVHIVVTSNLKESGQKVLRLSFVETYVTGDLADKDHGHHNTQENHDYDGVDQAKPVDSWVENVQIGIPSSCLEVVSTMHKRLSSTQTNPWCVRFLYVHE